MLGFLVGPARLWPAVATVAAGLELLKGLGLLHLSVSGLSLSLVLGAALAVAGALCWAKLSGKLHVTAATVIMLVGVSQVLTGALPR